MTEVLEGIGSPYSSEFVQLFMPMVESEEITGTMRGDGEKDPVSEFIGMSLNITCFYYQNKLKKPFGVINNI